MSSIKRRKVDPTTAARASVRGIAAFTKVSKAQVISQPLYDKTLAATTNIDTADTFGKRKLQPAKEEQVDQVEEASVPVITITNTADRQIRPLPQRRSVSAQSLLKTPQRPIVPPASPISTPGSVETPTNGAQDLLNRICLNSPSSSTPSSSFNDSEVNLDSSQTTISSQYDPSSDELPQKLIDLSNLHSSFLTALSIHYAHNGTHTPADLRLLCPNVTRAWGKRRVVLDDIKRILAILNLDSASGSTLLSLSDYGQNKICVETRVPDRAGRIAKPLDENTMNATFTTNITSLWQKSTPQEIDAFISTLPVEPVRICSSLAKMSPLLAKGQRRLKFIREGIAIGKAIEATKTTDVKPVDASGNRPTLLERLRAKALAKANAPACPTKEDLARKSALGRMEEVVATLTQLSTSSSAGQSRVSFTMPTVVVSLKDSFRSPISAKEAEDCVRLLAGEIAPRWLKIVKRGRMESVVVSRDERPSDRVIRERIGKA
ncbi:hypothetical protein VC83_06319 [Pseudogymnoascus destructans]|uniref:DNA replication factor Cdt1 C-terminal domain-containing protein n=2 Tax=Pseudogymnoascus destructans TaxID=655981 RepID=L8FLP5_PSED2|nr:uncharacterized protein VC83_06319 [Pseudogymnoascus destructans]ELR01857.1 hypothetical protein GMDG_05044 [Pseudogymnoascus destructans 20631-21]OAF58877.1 hypothetical protein VC83_06319 [Pseudogymnoascus destructans]